MPLPLRAMATSKIGWKAGLGRMATTEFSSTFKEGDRGGVVVFQLDDFAKQAVGTSLNLLLRRWPDFPTLLLIELYNPLVLENAHLLWI